MDFLLISHLVQWLVLIIFLAALLAFARQLGIIFERIAPMGALVADQGPAIGSTSRLFNLKSLKNIDIKIGGKGAKTLLFFVAPTCPVCKKLLPIVRAIRHNESGLRVILASDGSLEQQIQFYETQGLSDFDLVLSTEMGMYFGVGKLPYAVLLDDEGIIRAKGLVNNREQIESLLNAHELGVASVQEFVHNHNTNH